MSPELYHGRTTQVEGRASLSRAWLYELVHRDRHHGGNLYKCLPRQGRKYRNDCPVMPVAAKSRTGLISDQRPPAVDTRNAPGHWEMDTIIGHGHQGVLLTAIERYSRLTRILVLPHRQARFIALATIEMLLPYECVLNSVYGMDNVIDCTGDLESPGLGLKRRKKYD